MTKSDRIRQLLAHEFFTDREIAFIVAKDYGSCMEEYVRAVKYRPHPKCKTRKYKWNGIPHNRDGAHKQIF